MFTVRFPEGAAITYRDATFLRYTEHSFELYSKDPEKGGVWIASIPVATQCVIETANGRPGDVHNPLLNNSLYAAADRVIDYLRELDYWRLKRLKAGLADFNAKTGDWK